MKSRLQLCSLTIALVVASTLLLAGTASAQDETTFSVEFQGVALSKVLESFKRLEPGFAYTLPPGAESKKITASLVGVNVEEALGTVLDLVNLRFVKDNNVYSIREKAKRTEGRVSRLMPQYGSPIITSRPVAPTTETGGAQAATGGASEKKDEEDERANLPFRVLTVRYADPALLAELFGGDVIEGGMMGGGGSGGSSGGSSRGGSTGGSSRGGSSRGGSSGGSSRGGSSRGGSSGGSSRGGSSRGGSSGGSSRY